MLHRATMHWVSLPTTTCDSAAPSAVSALASEAAGAALDCSRAARARSPRLALILAATAGLLLASATAAAQVGPSSVVGSSFEFREGSHLAFDLSPDGRTIAFDLLGQLWLVPAEGGEARPITDAQRDTAEYHEPLFSPDGERLLYWSDQADTITFWTRSLRTGEVTRIGGELLPRTWSADGRALFVTQQSTAGGAWASMIQRRDLKAGTSTPITISGTPARSVRDAAPAPDGKRLAFVNVTHPLVRLGRVWSVGVDGGVAVPVTPTGVEGMQPTYAPDGERVAYFGPDSAGILQLWIVERAGSVPRQLTRHETATEAISCGVVGVPYCTWPLRARWTPDGGRLVYAWEGRLWSVPASGGQSREIPFTARVNFQASRSTLPPVRLPDAGERVSARGHTGLALSPDGRQIAMLAFDSVWVATIGGPARALAGTPWNASNVIWSPDAASLLWSAGAPGAEDVFVTRVADGETRRITRLPGAETQATWSPDRRHIALVHTDTGARTAPRLLVVPASGDLDIVSPTQGRDLGPALGIWRSSSAPQDRQLQWSPDGTALLMHAGPARGARTVTVVPLDGERRDVPVPRTVSYLRWLPDGQLAYTEANQLWRVPFSVDSGAVGQPALVDSAAAAYLSAARDGSLLFVSGDGLRVRRPNGATDRVRWPVATRVAAHAPLLLRNLRIVDGTGAPATAPRDMLVRDGRIVRIAAAGSITPPGGARVLDAGGRIALPGLIDGHQHLNRGDRLLPALLYHGVTTIRVPHARLAQVAAMRDAVHAGVRPGPRMVIGAHFSPGCWFADCLRSDDAQYTVGRDDARRALAITRALGAEVAKMYLPMSMRAGARFIEDAHASGMRVTGHMAHTLPLLAAGMDGKEHAAQDWDRTMPSLREDMLQLSRASRLVVTPTMAVLAQIPLVLDDSGLLADPATALLYGPDARRRVHDEGLVRPENRAWAEAQLAEWRRRTLQYHRAGVPVAVGTDGSLPWLVHLELEELVQAGLTPLEAITAGTSVTARALGVERELGTLAIGRRADLVIVEGDPTVDIRDTRRIWEIVQGGQVVDRQRLLQLLRTNGGL